MSGVRSGLLISLLFLPGCSWLVGDHPFSATPRTKGKLDKTPEVFIQRGQTPEVCRTDEKNFTLYYFIHLRWMPAQRLWVADGNGGEIELFGKDFTIRVGARAKAGMMAWFKTEFRTEKQSYYVTTLVVDCTAPAGNSWTSSGTTNGFAAPVVGS